jgi:nucleotide-binding universal stress UspA family protein
MYQRILVPLDGSPTAERGLREAIALAARLGAGLHLVHVLDAYPLLVEMASTASVGDYQRDLRHHGEEVLEKARLAAAEAGVKADVSLREMVRQRVSDVIVDEAGRAGCDLILMGTHGRRGFSHFTLGSDAERVMRHSTVPLLLVRQPG